MVKRKLNDKVGNNIIVIVQTIIGSILWYIFESKGFDMLIKMFITISLAFTMGYIFSIENIEHGSTVFVFQTIFILMFFWSMRPAYQIIFRKNE